MQRSRFSGAAIVAAALFTADASARSLSFDERVTAQSVVERVYYSHQLGATEPFEKAVPRAVLERKVRQSLKKSQALDDLWKTPITGEMLAAELDRIVASTRLPDRLLEVYGALGDDPFLLAECVARPALVDRLARRFFAADERFAGATWEQFWAEHEASFDEGRVRAVGYGGRALRRPEAGGGNATSLAPPDDLWDNGQLDDVPDPRWGHVAVWTGSLMLVWGGSPSWYTTAQVEGGRYDPLTDTWAPMTAAGEPASRETLRGLDRQPSHRLGRPGRSRQPHGHRWKLRSRDRHLDSAGCCGSAVGAGRSHGGLDREPLHRLGRQRRGRRSPEHGRHLRPRRQHLDGGDHDRGTGRARKPHGGVDREPHGRLGWIRRRRDPQLRGQIRPGGELLADHEDDHRTDRPVPPHCDLDGHSDDRLGWHRRQWRRSGRRGEL